MHSMGCPFRLHRADFSGKPDLAFGARPAHRQPTRITGWRKSTTTTCGTPNRPPRWTTWDGIC
ncbi:MAG: hypothetical protein OSB46_08635 [Alphaproteobacteria bacterium]|nr:hypothetical protein [Alphaproteobacteria bacterium]